MPCLTHLTSARGVYWVTERQPKCSPRCSAKLLPPVDTAWPWPISQSFSYSAGGISPHAECSLSLLYQDTHSAVATVTSPASCHGPSRLINSFLYREFTASAA